MRTISHHPTLRTLVSAFLTTATIASFAMPADLQAKQVTDAYVFKMTLQVPRVYDNTQSLGYRKYQKQVVTGRMFITYDTSRESRPVITFSKLVNQQHKVNGAKVVYDVTVEEYVTPLVNAIGSNQTGEFKTPTAIFAIQAWPSYAKGAPDEDNSLNVVLSGKGITSLIGSSRVVKKISGSVAGALGCSCTAYGHVSPTRVMGAFGPTDLVDDVAAVFGTWQAVRIANSRQ